MTVTTNGPITLNLSKTKTITVSDNMPYVLFEYVYNDVIVAVPAMKTDGPVKSIIQTWFNETGIERLREIESAMNPDQRRRFHIALFTCLEPDEALKILWPTTIHRMMSAATLPKIEAMLEPYKKGADTAVDTLGRLIADYDDMIVEMNNDDDDGQRDELEERLAEVKRLEANLSERIAKWNEERKMAEEAELDCIEPSEEYQELYNRYTELDYQNTLLRELLKNLL